MTYNLSYQRNDNIVIDKSGFFLCPYCGESFRALAYHTRQAHNVSAKMLREAFNLPLNFSLQTPELKECRRKAALDNNMDEQLKIAGKNTRFILGMKPSIVMVERIRRGHMKKTRRTVSL